MLAEDTHEHREILGEEIETVMYFKDTKEMVEKSRWMIEHPDESRLMGERLALRVTAGSNTYGDRLKTILGIAGGLSAAAEQNENPADFVGSQHHSDA